MGCTQRGNLWQVGDGNHLTISLAHVGHDVGHLFGHSSTNARVYFVKNDGGQLNRIAYHRLQREHHSSYFTTRSHLTYRLQGRVGVGTKQERNLVAAVGRQLLGTQHDLELHLGDAQFHQHSLQLLLYLLRTLLADSG